MIKTHIAFKFNDENLKKSKKFMKKYPKGLHRSAVKGLLDMAQRQINNDKTDGWITSEKIEYVASLLNMSFAQVYEVCTFYTMFNLNPVGKFHIKICTTVPCCLVGANELKEVCIKTLNIGMNETTEDGLVTLKEVECIGACVNAPVVQINDDYLEDLKVEDMQVVLKNIQDGMPFKIGSYKNRQGSRAKDDAA